MSIVLPAMAVAFAALCVWLAVRIVNRRERWAKWMAIGMVVGLPVLYLLSFGPACSMVDDFYNEFAEEIVPTIYFPILWLDRADQMGGSGRFHAWFEWYATLFRRDQARPMLTLDGEAHWVVPVPTQYIPR